ncbi:MAG: hypothetical protein JNM06_22275 [Blastocatellia bacterium]|nr:hypothetical protein [Blastocatellia bacterium]MBN8723330.1 hypothetical protein [Acidobacteriota bacterium]
MRRVLFIFAAIIFLGSLTTEALAQGSYGTGKLPNTAPKIRRELKTIVIIESVNNEELTFKGTDEITGDKLSYRASKRTSIYAEKSLFSVFGKKELAFADLQKGQRLEIKYNELLPTSVTEIKVLKPKEEKK